MRLGGIEGPRELEPTTDSIYPWLLYNKYEIHRQYKTKEDMRLDLIKLKLAGISYHVYNYGTLYDPVEGREALGWYPVLMGEL